MPKMIFVNLPVAAYVSRAKARPAYARAFAAQLADYDGQPFTM